MKKITLNLFMAAVAVLCFFGGCEKIQRGQYTGIWDFMVLDWVWSQGSGWKNDTTYYLGKISRGATYNKLKIEYKENTTITMDIDETGTLSKFYKNSFEYANGQFNGNDNVQIHLGYDDGALGGNCGKSIYGTKK